MTTTNNDHYPLRKIHSNGKMKNSEIETVLCDTILERLLHRTDNNATRNYLMGSIEYCLLSSSQMLIMDEDEDGNDDGKEQSEGIGFVNNISFLSSFVTVYLQHYKSIDKSAWTASNEVLMVLLLRTIALFLAGVTMQCPFTFIHRDSSPIIHYDGSSW